MLLARIFSSYTKSLNIGLFTGFEPLNCSLIDDNDCNLATLNCPQTDYIQRLNNDIAPLCSVVSHFIDPFKINICYVFVEYILSRDIKHFTIDYMDNVSSKLIKTKILFKEINSNFIFNQCLLNNSMDEEKTEDFVAKLLVLGFDSDNLFDSIMSKFMCLLSKIDYKILKLYCVEQSAEVENIDNINSQSRNKISAFINACNKTNDINIDFCLISNNDSKSSMELHVEHLKNYICNRLDFFNHFKKISLNKQYSLISNFTDSTVQFCIRHNITSKFIIIFALLLIKEIQNKFFQFTLLLCWCNLFIDQKHEKNTCRMLKLITFIIVNRHQNEIYVKESDKLYLLYRIIQFGNYKPISMIIFDEMCILDQPHNKYMKDMLIRRYLFFITGFHTINSCYLKYLHLDQQNFELTWMFIKMCIQTTYKLLKITV